MSGAHGDSIALDSTVPAPAPDTRYDGLQHRPGLTPLYQFTDLITGSTFFVDPAAGGQTVARQQRLVWARYNIEQADHLPLDDFYDPRRESLGG